MKSLEVETSVKIIQDSFLLLTFLNILDAYAYTLAYTHKSVEESVIEVDRCSGRQMSNNLIGFFWGTSEYIHLNWASVEINSQNHGTKSYLFILFIFFTPEQALFCGSGFELNLHPKPVTHTQMLLIAYLHFKQHLKGYWGRGEKTTTNLHFSSTALAGGVLMNNSMIH